MNPTELVAEITTTIETYKDNAEELPIENIQHIREELVVLGMQLAQVIPQIKLEVSLAEIEVKRCEANSITKCNEGKKSVSICKEYSRIECHDVNVLAAQKREIQDLLAKVENMLNQSLNALASRISISIKMLSA